MFGLIDFEVISGPRRQSGLPPQPEGRENRPLSALSSLGAGSGCSGSSVGVSGSAFGAGVVSGSTALPSLSFFRKGEGGLFP